MNNKKLVQIIFLLIPVLYLLVTINGCKDFKEPDVLQPTIKTTGTPKIDDVIPHSGAVAGVREITILGSNFTAGDTTWILIGSYLHPLIKSITDTKIVIYRPPIFGNSLDIKVVIPSSDNLSTIHNYSIDAPIDSINTFLFGSGLPDYYAMDIDKSGRYWAFGNKRIDTVSANGLFFGKYKGSLPGAFSVPTEGKFGKGGYMYIGVNRAEIYRISPDNGDSRMQTYASISGGTANKFDFDPDGNIYVGGTGGLYIVRPATDSTGTAEASGHYANRLFTEVRVAGSYLYSADSTTIWRNSITGGSLGPDEQLTDISTKPGLKTCKISSMNVDEAGNVYMVLQNHPQYSLFALDNDGSVTPFYVDNILPISVRQIIWAYNSKYLYLDRSRMLNSGIRLYRIGMENKGAVNNGREF